MDEYQFKRDSRVHYFGEEIILFSKNGNYLLNKVQAEILELINKKHSLKDVVKSIKLGEVINDKNKFEFLITGFIDKLVKMDILERGTDAISFSGKKGFFYPLKITLELTNKCHLNCQHCFKECSPLKGEKFDLLSYQEVIQELSEFTPSVQLTGGEPMLHPQFERIGELCVDNFENVSLTTTGAFINKRNINLIQNFNDIQVSLYSSNPNVHDSITRQKGSFVRTLNGINLMNQNNVNYNVTNIVRKKLLNHIEEYIEFLISQKVSRVSFGILSSLGRGSEVQKEWNLVDEELVYFESILQQYRIKYQGSINIANWSASHGTFLKSISNTKMLLCGAGALEWNITEQGRIKPCSFFPDNYFTQYGLLDYKKYVTCNRSNQVFNSIKEWEEELNSVGLSTQSICDEIYRVLRGTK